MSTPRSVGEVKNGIRTLEGAGFLVRRPFPVPALDHVDPFLLLDEMGPMQLEPGQAKGAPDHPHRGFETVTYLLSGRMEHRDSAGNAGSLGPGDVQWMTAGAGVVHSEMPAESFQREGGKMHGFQLWVNLPAKEKLTAPRYQEIPAERIPVATTPDGLARVRVIAGEALGVRAVIDTRTPILYHHWTLEAGAEVVQPIPPDYNLFAWIFRGRGRFGANEQPANDGQLLLFRSDGDHALLRADKKTEVLLVGGVPLNEPVARYGPFVMNTEAELVEAVADFRAGRLGRISH